MLGELVPCAGGPPISLPRPRLLLGRHGRCDIPLPFATVSARHCELELLEGFWHARDLGSSNGTSVNGQKCASDWLLPNDILALAQYRYKITYRPSHDRAPPRSVAPPAESPKTLGTLPNPPGQAPSDRDAANASLGCLVPCGGGQPIPLFKPLLIVGRDPRCDICLSLGHVSGRHCQLDFVNGAWRVRDLASRNGIKVDGGRCQEGTLRPGGILTIANLRFQVDYGSSRPEQPHKGPVFVQSLLQKAGLERWQPALAPDDDEGSRQRYKLTE